MSPNSLPAIFTSVIVKREAVDRSFPGGVGEFTRVLEPAKDNNDLLVLARMSSADADLVFQMLHAAGLVPGEDFGLVGMREGVLFPCNGIRATVEELEPFVVQWSVHLDPAYVVQPEDVTYDWQPPEPKPETKPEAQRIKPPPGLTANQYYQWRSLHSPEDDDEWNGGEDASGAPSEPVEAEGALTVPGGPRTDQERPVPPLLSLRDLWRS